MEWEEKVYKSKEVDYRLTTLPRHKVLKRDKYTCQSCRKRLTASELQIHHIKPRSEGGTNIMSNLITLCWRCHDLIELAEPPIRTLQEILYHAQALDLLNQMLDNPIEYATDNDWRKWVYGSMKKPG